MRRWRSTGAPPPVPAQDLPVPAQKLPCSAKQSSQFFEPSRLPVAAFARRSRRAGARPAPGQRNSCCAGSWPVCSARPLRVFHRTRRAPRVLARAAALPRLQPGPGGVRRRFHRRLRSSRMFHLFFAPEGPAGGEGRQVGQDGTISCQSRNCVLYLFFLAPTENTPLSDPVEAAPTIRRNRSPAAKRGAPKENKPGESGRQLPEPRRVDRRGRGARGRD
jgi:hypothetical protein